MITVRHMNVDRFVAVVQIFLSLAGAVLSWYAASFRWSPFMVTLAVLWTAACLVHLFHLPFRWWPRDRDFEERVELRRRLRRKAP